jgi:hypothetical protein
VEAVYERIPGIVEELRAEAARAAEGASDMLGRFYGTHVQPALVGPAATWSYLIDPRSGRDRHATDFAGLRSFLTGEDRERADRLESIVLRKLELEAHYTWQTALRAWLLVHVPAAMVLAALVVAHVAAVWFF